MNFSCFKGTMINNISFKGTYKIDSTNNSHEKIMQTMGFFGRLEERRIEIDEYARFPEKLGQPTKLTYVVPDDFNWDVEKYLQTSGINFRRISYADLFGEKGIKARMVIPKHCNKDEWRVVEVKAKEFNEIYKKTSPTYIGDKGNVVELPERNERFKQFLKSGLDIEASQVYLSEACGRLKVAFNDGRHRYAVMRDDLRFEKIPLALDRDSVKLAKKYGLID